MKPRMSKVMHPKAAATQEKLWRSHATAISKLPPHAPQSDFAGEWDTQMFVGSIRPKSGPHFTEATEWVNAIVSPPTRSSLGERIVSRLAKRGLANLFLGGDMWQTMKAGKGVPNQPKHHEPPSANDGYLVRDQAAAFIRDMWACLWADERLWKLVSLGSSPAQLAEFIARHFFLILPLASASVWSELAADARLLRSLVKALPSHPERLCGWVASNATRNLAGRIRRPEFGRVAARYVSSPKTASKALAELNYSGPQYLLLADALRKMAATAQACAEQRGAAAHESFSPPVKRRIPSREQAEKIEKFAVLVKRSPGEPDMVLARRFLQGIGKTGKAMENMMPSVRSDFSKAGRLLKLRHGRSKMKRH